MELMMSQVNKAVDQGRPIILMGDLNLDRNRINDSSYHLKNLITKINDTLSSCGMSCAELGNTFACQRQTRSGLKTIESALDHIYIDDGLKADCYKIENGMSDHLPVAAEIHCKKNKRTTSSKIVIRRSFKNFSYEQFRQDLYKYPWESFSTVDDPNEMVRVLEDVINNSLDRLAPVREFKIPSNYRHGLTDGTRMMMNQRDVARRKACEAKGEAGQSECWREYRRIRNKCTSLIRRDVRNATSNMMEGKYGKKNIWKVVNTIISPKTNEKIKLKIDGQGVLTNDKQIADEFNSFFVRKIENLRNNIDPSLKQDPLRILRNAAQDMKNPWFTLKTVSENQVVEYIKCLNNTKSVGRDLISTDILKGAPEAVSIPIARIINTSIRTGIFPERWKTSLVTPLHKRGSREEVGNYRPVSILPIASKILEMAVHKQISKHAETNGLIPEYQHGFRSKRSTTTALLSMVSKWGQDLKNHKYVIILMFDLSAAFDTLDKHVLCEKLRIIGFDEISRKWIGSFMSRRRQVVKIENATSEETAVNIGSPQGGILSPLLFILYVMDIGLWTNASVCSYADDTTISMAGDDLEWLKKSMEVEANKVLSFMASNELVANPTKTEMMIMCRNKVDVSKETLRLGDAMITAKSEVKLLGMKISSDLSWKGQVRETVQKINQGLGVMRRLATRIRRDELLPVVQGIIMSKLRHGIAIFGSVRTCSEDPICTSMKTLQTAINKVMRILANKKLNDCVPVKEMIETTSIPAVNHIVAENILMMSFRAMNGNIPNLSCHLHRTMEKQSNMMTRGMVEGNIYTTLMCYRQTDEFITKAVKLWNMLPQEVKAETSERKFKGAIRKFCRSLPI